MTTFWLVGALMILLALAFVLPPLLRTPVPVDPRRRALDQAHRTGVLDSAEYSAKLAALGAVEPAISSSYNNRLVALFVAVFIALGSIGLYAKLGDPRVFDPAVQSVATAMQQAQQAGLTPMDQAIAGLVERLAREPEDVEGWMLLGRAYKSTEQFDQARDAMARALTLSPEDPSIMVEYAEAKTLAAPDKLFQGEALQLLDQALQRDPDNQRALWLRGIAHFQVGDTEAAATTWEHLLAVLPADSSVRDSVSQQLAQLRSRAPDANSAPEAAADTNASTTPPRLSVKVSLAPELAAKVQPDDVLFVFARAAQGSRAPLAIERRHARELPLSVELDDSDAMVAQMNLSSTARIVVGARISRSGNAQAQPGDLETVSEPLPNSHGQVIELVIDQVVP